MKNRQNSLSLTLKQLRRQYGMTQEDLSIKTGVGLNFVREFEQGKPTVRMDKVAQVFSIFDYHLVAVKKTNENK